MFCYVLGEKKLCDECDECVGGYWFDISVIIVM